jgi:hypothetical protein
MDLGAGLRGELQIRATEAHEVDMVNGQMGGKVIVVVLGHKAAEVLDGRHRTHRRIGACWIPKPFMLQALQHR